MEETSSPTPEFSPAGSVASEPEDIFSTVDYNVQPSDSGQSPAQFPTPQSLAPNSPAISLASTAPLDSDVTESDTVEADDTPSFVSRRRTPRISRPVLIGGGVVLGLVLLGGIVWGLFSWLVGSEPEPEEVEEVPVIQPIIVENDTPTIEIPDSTTPGDSSPQATFVDTDHDGLSDQEEVEHNTNPKKVDTDEDGLTDREEIRVYDTDPRDGDTDDDGFLDGAEVSNFYDPNDPNPNKRLYDF